MTESSSRRRSIAAVGSAALIVQAVAVLVVLSGRPPVLLPIRATLGGRPVEVTTVDLGLAAAVLAVLTAVALAPAVWARPALGRAIDAALVAPVIVFLVACLNGVTEVAALVPLYALASGSAALVALEPVMGEPARRRRMSLAAAIGIVPWGVIAFTQVGSVIVGEAPSIAVRLLTLAMLAAAIVTFVLQWRSRRGGRDHAVALLVASVLAVSVFGWFVVVGLA